MKSIREKAEEYDKVVKRISENTSLVDMSGRKQFEAGANYVLMEILDKTSKCITIKDAYEAFLECVKQLKK